MPMIDVYAVAGTFGDTRTLARELAPRSCAGRVLLTESPEGGWGIAGHAYASDEIVAAARAQLATGSEAAEPG